MLPYTAIWREHHIPQTLFSTIPVTMSCMETEQPRPRHRGGASGGNRVAGAGAAFLACLSAASAAPSATPTSGVFTIWSTLNSSCEKQYGPIDLPDTPARAYVDNLGRTVLVAVDSTSRLSYGPSLLNTTRNCTIVWNSTSSPDPSVYATNDGFLDAVHSFGNGTIAALVHDEYPGMNYHNCNATPPTWPYCWMVSLSLAVSHDWGSSWSHASPPPTNLVAALPYPYESSHTIFGWGDSGGITPHPTDGFYYVAMNNRHVKSQRSRRRDPPTHPHPHIPTSASAV